MAMVHCITTGGSIVVRQHDNEAASSLLLVPHDGDEAIEVYHIHCTV